MKYKSLAFLFIIIVSTAAVILLPRNVSNRFLFDDSEVYCEYTRASKPVLTDRQFTEMYLNREFDEDNIGYSSEDLSEEEIKENVRKLFEKVIDDNDELLSFIADAEIRSYGDRSILTVFDNCPVAVKFSSVDFRRGDTYLSLTYEEKTASLLYLSFYSMYTDTAYVKKGQTLATEIITCVEKHYTEHLLLDRNCWYSNLSVEESEKNGVWYCVAEIGLELIPKYEGMIKEEKYNLDT